MHHTPIGFRAGTSTSTMYLPIYPWPPLALFTLQMYITLQCIDEHSFIFFLGVKYAAEKYLTVLWTL